MLNLSIQNKPKHSLKPSKHHVYPNGSLVDAANKRPIIFAHDTAFVPGEERISTHINEVKKYPERALLIARSSKDTVLVNNLPDSSYVDYLNRIKVYPKEIISFRSKDLTEGIKKDKHLKKSNFSYYSPYYSSIKDITAGKEITPNILGASEDIVSKYYDKASFKDICIQNNLPVAKGEVFEKTQNKELDRKNLIKLISKYIPKTGEVIIRETGLAAGISLVFVNRNNIDEMSKKVISSDGNKYLVEVKEKIKASPSIIGYVTNNKVKILAQTSQLLDGNLMYLGNVIKYNKHINSKLYSYVKTISKSMIKDGYSGPFGIDFIKTQDNRYLPVECNARITGAFYPHELRQRILENGHRFNIAMSFTQKSKSYNSFKEFESNKEISNLLYKGDNQSGLVPFNVSMLQQGKFQGIVLANTLEEAFTIKNRISKLISSKS